MKSTCKCKTTEKCHYVIKQHNTYNHIPIISTKLVFKDYWGALKVRCGFSRHKYMILPGLYAVGAPDQDAQVLVTANYKLTFDSLRKHLTGLNCWLMVLDTKGINVWCAAGKGTFGTDELVNRIEKCGLANIIKHKKLILPQLGSVGVSAHKTKKRSGFNVIYGPVYASDIPAYFSNGLKIRSEMRKVYFNLYQRFILTPNEFKMSFKYLLLGMFLTLIVGNIKINPQTSSVFIIKGMLGLLCAYIAGTILGPVFLPYLPGRSFSAKGFWLGLVIAVSVVFLFSRGINYLADFGIALIMISTTSFLTMNFTGSSTYTSISGVLKEMRFALPLQIGSVVLGSLLFIISRFV